MLQRGGTYQFEDTEDWIDIALQILKHVSWSPECSQSWKVNAKKAPPTKRKDGQISPGLHREDIQERSAKNFPEDASKIKIEVHMSTAFADGLATIVGLVRSSNAIVHRTDEKNRQSISMKRPRHWRCRPSKNTLERVTSIEKNRFSLRCTQEPKTCYTF